jgi:ankyrin repeat protein
MYTLCFVAHYIFSHFYRRKGGFGLFRKGKKQNEIEFVEASPSNITDLPTLIKNQNWDGVLHQLRVNPCDADEELHVTTRGGFTSTSGFMPLHFACERRPPLEVIEALIAACPGAVMSRAMPGGALPLHIACTWYAPASAISALLVADKTACKMPDELGNVPLHSACFSGTSTAVIESILRAYPKSVLGRNHQGSLPEDICKRLRHDNRRPVLGILNIVRVEIVLKKKAKHAQKHSSGSIQEMANEAIAINQRDGPPMMSLEDHVNVYGEDPALGVEVSYGAGNQELVWI